MENTINPEADQSSPRARPVLHAIRRLLAGCTETRILAWLDVAAKLALPAVAGYFGLQLSEAQNQETVQSHQKEELDRDYRRNLDLVKMLMSKDSRDNLVALIEVNALKTKGRLSPDVVGTLHLIESGNSTDLRTILARRALDEARLDKATQNAVNEARGIQIKVVNFFGKNGSARPSDVQCYRAFVAKNRSAFGSAEFFTEQHLGSSDQVRYFYKEDQGRAYQIAQTLNSQCTDKRFTVIEDLDDRGDMPIGTLEVWFSQA